MILSARVRGTRGIPSLAPPAVRAAAGLPPAAGL